MGRRQYSPTDFGYDFPTTETNERESLVAPAPPPPPAAAAAAPPPPKSSRPVAGIEGKSGSGYELYDDQRQQQEAEEERRQQQQQQTQTTTTTPTPTQASSYYRYQPAKINRGGESYFVPGGSGSGDHSASTEIKIINPIELLGGVCCCLTVALLILGGVLVAYARYRNSSSSDEEEDPLLLLLLLLTGSLLLVVAAGTCLCGCCTLCIGTTISGLSSSSSSSSSSGRSKSSIISGGAEDPNYREIEVRFRRLNDRYEKGCMAAEDGLRNVRLDVVGHMKEVKEAAKREAKQKKEKEKRDREELEGRVRRDLEEGRCSVKEIRERYRPVVFYIVFDATATVSSSSSGGGGMMLSGGSLELLRKQVSLVVNLGRPGHDECLVAITSPGGAVSPYGLAASQLVRIRKAGIHLTCCIDVVAASGGYMMASVANTICAAPFAMVGSIGVVAHVPNFHRFLNEHKIDAYLMTAGEHKRTVDVIGEVTEEGKAKMREQLDDIHAAFKEHVALARPKLRDHMETIGTGEHWLAVQAKEKGLVDKILTSDEYLESVCETHDIIEILEKIYKPPRGLGGLLSLSLSGLLIGDNNVNVSSDDDFFSLVTSAAGKALVDSVLDRFRRLGTEPQPMPMPMAATTVV